MKNKWLILVLSLVFVVLNYPANAALTMFEDWSMGIHNQNIHSYNGWVGVSRSDTSVWTGPQSDDARLIGIDAGSGNLASRLKSPSWQSRGFYKALGDKSIQDNTTGTLFFRFQATSVTNLLHRYSLSDVAAPNNTGADVVVLYFQPQDATHYKISGLNGAAFLNLKTDLVANTWYYVWVVVNQITDKYDVYLTQGSLPTGTDKIGTNLSFRAAKTVPLITFFAWVGKMGGTSSAPFYVDDIAIDPASQSLTLPIIARSSNPLPANASINIGTINGSKVSATMTWNTAVDPNNPSSPNPNITKHYVYLSSSNPADPNMYLVSTIDAGNPVAATGSYGPVNLDLDARYYWRVDESINNSAPGDPATISGVKWYFNTLLSLPIITQQPQNTLVANGSSASINVVVTSVSTATYKWFKTTDAANNTPGDDTQVGSADTLTINPATVTNEGYYFCQITNSAGPVNSNVVRLGIKRLMAYWTMDQADFDGTYYLDKSAEDPIADNADPNGTPVFTTNINSQANKAVQIDTGNGWATAGTFDPSLYSNQFTISAWIKTNALGAAQGILCKRDAWAADQMKWCFRMDTDGAIRLYTYTEALISPTKVTAGQWTHVACTFTNGTGQLYINGVASGSTAALTLNTKPSATMRIGYIDPLAGSVLPFNGSLDDVKVYNYALDKYGIADLYVNLSGKSVCIQTYQNTFDYDGNCKVDISDVVTFASFWLNCGLYPASTCQ